MSEIKAGITFVNPAAGELSYKVIGAKDEIVITPTATIGEDGEPEFHLEIVVYGRLPVGFTIDTLEYAFECLKANQVEIEEQQKALGIEKIEETGV